MGTMGCPKAMTIWPLLLLLVQRLEAEPDRLQTTLKKNADTDTYLLPVHSVHGFKPGDAVRIKDGSRTEKKEVSQVRQTASDLVLTQGLRYDHKSGVSVMKLTAAEWSSTVTTDKAKEGQKELHVSKTNGFHTGQKVLIGEGDTREAHTVDVKHGDHSTLYLEEALSHSHPAGTEVVGDTEQEHHDEHEEHHHGHEEHHESHHEASHHTVASEGQSSQAAVEGDREAKTWLSHKGDGRLVTETSLRKGAESNSDVLEVYSTDGFSKGDAIWVESKADKVWEVVDLKGVDRIRKELQLEKRLDASYHKGAPVSKLEEHVKGEYGFISDFHSIDEEEARRRVRRLVHLFGVKEFEFYNAFEGFSKPPSDHKDEWNCASFQQPVRRSLIKVYTDEIAKQGGRSWLGVVGMATDPGDTEAQEGTKVIGEQVVEGGILFDVVEPTRELAKRIAPMWADFAKSMGFSGIHWATVNGYATGGAAEKESDVKEFLRASWLQLEKEGLQQTWNFLNGFGWEKALVEDDIIAFTVWERFDSDINPFDGLSGGVVKLFPPSENEDYDIAMTFMTEMWVEARCNGMQLLAVGDGSKLLQNDYYPSAQTMTPKNIAHMHEKLFTHLDCTGDGIKYLRGVMEAKIEGIDSGVFSKQFEMLEALLKGLFHLEKVKVVAIKENSGAEHEERERRLGEEDEVFLVEFTGICRDQHCAERRHVTQHQAREKLQDTLAGHGLEGDVIWVKMRWEDQEPEVELGHGHEHHEEVMAKKGNSNLLTVVVVLLVVILLCCFLVFLELCWQRQQQSNKVGEAVGSPGPSPGRSDVMPIPDNAFLRNQTSSSFLNSPGARGAFRSSMDETHPLAREETVLAPGTAPQVTTVHVTVHEEEYGRGVF
jgi:hypothetical protein